ncbi:MAG: lytic transglycosylase domain-containing protein [Gammaproteobacteria bacterium]|nr:MAG: lytic transglycosylase domain-containing protein [Gammaproteobacteria bacterium]
MRLAVAIALAGLCLSFNAAAVSAGSINELIPSAYRKIGKEYSVPPAILYAIALTESEKLYKRSKGKGIARPWPWTINHRGKGLFFKTRAKAIAHAKSLLKKGDKNFDCCQMQVNWRWHNGKFSSIEDAFNPYNCMRAAARIIAGYKKQFGSYAVAVGKYHSPGNKKLQMAYRGRVMKKLKLILKGKRS